MNTGIWAVCVAMVLALLPGLAAESAWAAPILFAANPNDVTVTQIDTATGATTVIMDHSDGLTRPSEITFDSGGNLYVANVASPDVLRLSSGRTASVFVSGTGTLSSIQGLAFGIQGDLFILDGVKIYQYNAQTLALSLFGDVSTVNPAYTGAEDIEFDTTGNLYVATGENSQGRGAVVKFNSAGVGSIFASQLANPRDLAVDGLGHLYVANRLGKVIDRFDLNTGAGGLFADVAGLPGDPRGIKTDSENNVYLLNSSGNIYQWAPNGSGGAMIATSGSTFSEALAIQIPEPATLGLLALGGLALMRRSKPVS